MFQMTFEGEGNARIFEDEIRGIKLLTPLFVPSISGLKAKLHWMAQAIKDISLPQNIFMLSAFDLKLLDQKSIDIFDDFSEKNVLYLDSGGYEAFHKEETWEFLDYFEGLSRIRYDILTTFDRIPFNDEIDTVPEMKKYLLATNKLIKGGRKTLVLHATKYTKLTDLEAFIAEVKDEFDILGVPETLCGRGIEGVDTIRTLRAFMDKERIIKPIHIFGCGKLDFILQFVDAGADIFDANSWIYNYYNTSNLLAKNITKEEFDSCTCEPCQSQQYWSSEAKRRYVHNFSAIKKAMDMIRQSIKEDQLISLINQVKEQRFS